MRERVRLGLFQATHDADKVLDNPIKSNAGHRSKSPSPYDRVALTMRPATRDTPGCVCGTQEPQILLRSAATSTLQEVQLSAGSHHSLTHVNTTYDKAGVCGCSAPSARYFALLSQIASVREPQTLDLASRLSRPSLGINLCLA